MVKRIRHPKKVKIEEIKKPEEEKKKFVLEVQDSTMKSNSDFKK